MAEDRKVGAVAVLVGLCAAGIIGVTLTAGHLLGYVWSLSHTKLANPPPVGILILVPLGLLAVLASLAMAIWRLQPLSSPHRAVVSRWSNWYMLLWSLVVGWFLLINYPIPAQAHHVDRFLVGLLVVLFWSLWLLIGPVSLDRVLHTCWVGGLEVALVNLLIFLFLGEMAARLADPILARSGLFGDKHTPAHLKP